MRPDRPVLQVLLGQRDVTERCDGLTFSATDQGGFEIATLGLPASSRPLKGSPVMIRSGLEVAWQGRVAELAEHSEHGSATKTTGAEGLVALMRDNPMSMIYVDRDLTRWGAPSTQRQINLLAANQSLASSTAAVDTATGAPALVQELDDSWVSPFQPTAEAWYDAGALNTIAALYYNALASGPALATADTLALSSDDAATILESSGNLYSTVGNSGYFTPASAYRYAVAQKLYATTPAGAQGARYLTAWRNLAAYGPHGLPAQGPDPVGFYPSDIALHALSQCSGIVAGTVVPSLGYIAPHVTYPTPVTPDTIVSDMAKLMGFSWGVWEPDGIFSSSPRMDFRPPAPDATCVISKAECDQLDITTRLGDLYSRALISYTDAAGAAGVASVTLPCPALAEAGISGRTLILDMGAGSLGAATAFGTIALALSQISARAAGQATLPGYVRLANGSAKPAHLIRPGIDRLRILDYQDSGPLLSQGSARRDTFRISRTTTTVALDGSASTVAELDSGMNLLETLQARMALAAGVVGSGASGG